MKNKKRKIVGLIPVRLNSSRLFGKAILEIDSMPMVIHTYKRSLISKKLNDLYICTDSKKIIDIAKKFKCKYIITGKGLPLSLLLSHSMY